MTSSSMTSSTSMLAWLSKQQLLSECTRLQAQCDAANVAETANTDEMVHDLACDLASELATGDLPLLTFQQGEHVHVYQEGMVDTTGVCKWLNYRSGFSVVEISGEDYILKNDVLRPLMTVESTKVRGVKFFAVRLAYGTRPRIWFERDEDKAKEAFQYLKKNGKKPDRPARKRMRDGKYSAGTCAPDVHMSRRLSSASSSTCASESGECVICNDGPAEMAYVPCGHLSVCSHCSPLWSHECPSCRKPAQSMLRIYRP